MFALRYVSVYSTVKFQQTNENFPTFCFMNKEPIVLFTKPKTRRHGNLTITILKKIILLQQSGRGVFPTT